MNYLLKFIFRKSSIFAPYLCFLIRAKLEFYLQSFHSPSQVFVFLFPGSHLVILKSCQS